MYCLGFVDVGKVVAWVVRWGDHTCGKLFESLKMSYGTDFIFTTHLCSHSLQQDKVVSALVAIYQTLWLSQEHKSCQHHTGRSSSWQSTRWSSRSGSQVLQGECRVGQGWEGWRGRLNLLMRFNIWQQQSESYLDQSAMKSNLSQKQARWSSAEIINLPDSV